MRHHYRYGDTVSVTTARKAFRGDFEIFSPCRHGERQLRTRECNHSRRSTPKGHPNNSRSWPLIAPKLTIQQSIGSIGFISRVAKLVLFSRRGLRILPMAASSALDSSMFTTRDAWEPPSVNYNVKMDEKKSSYDGRVTDSSWLTRSLPWEVLPWLGWQMVSVYPLYVRISENVLDIKSYPWE